MSITDWDAMRGYEHAAKELASLVDSWKDATIAPEIDEDGIRQSLVPQIPWPV
jgi:hypothetical protein